MTERRVRRDPYADPSPRDVFLENDPDTSPSNAGAASRPA